jgi:hypothetical protein
MWMRALSVADGRVHGVDEREFWRLIEAVSWMEGDRDARAGWLIRQLAARPPDEIVRFQVLFDVASARLSTSLVRGAAHRVMGWCTDDAFGDFRAWVIGLGRDGCARVAADPDSLAALPAVRRLAGRPVRDWAPSEWPAWESLAYAADTAYDVALGYRANIYAAAREMAPPAAARPDDRWDYDDDAASARRLPRLTRLFPTTDPVARGILPPVG